MGKCVDRGYIPYAEITICDGCFHREVCDDRDYLTENICSARVGGCYCRECRWGQRDGLGVMHCHKYHIHKNPGGYCDDGEPREAQEDG